MFGKWSGRIGRKTCVAQQGIFCRKLVPAASSNRSQYYIALQCATVLLLASANAAIAKDKFVFILPSLGNPYWQAVKKGIEDSAKATESSTTVLSAVSDQAKEEFLNLCQAAISQKPSLIVVCTTTDTTTIQCLRAAQSHKIKVAVIDHMISSEQAKKAGVKLSFSIGTDNTMLGQKAAEFVVKEVKAASPKILVLDGVVGNTNSADRVSGFKKAISGALPGAKIVNTVSADWDRLKALNITSDTIQRTPDLTVVFAANDMMALGAAEAVRVAGKTKDVLVVGIDGVADARKAILAGRLNASVAQLPYLIGKRSVELAMDAMKGREPTQREQTPLLVLTKNVLESNKDPLLKNVR
jgi:D-allose transport system substrate-binding protein